MAVRRSACLSNFREDSFPLAQHFLAFQFWLHITDSADCWKLQLVTPSPHPPGHPTSDNSGRGGLASFRVFSMGCSLLRAHRRLARRPRQRASQALPQSWRGCLLLEPHLLPFPVSTTFFLLPIPASKVEKKYD